MIGDFDPTRASLDTLRERLSWLTDHFERKEVQTEISWRQHWKAHGIMGNRLPWKDK